MNKEQISDILRKHELWLNGEKDGARADLSYADLSYADLSYATLKGADLIGADLRDANLSGADLSHASLIRADLNGANLSGAITDKRYVQISCIGSRKGTTTYCFEDDWVICGCWNKYQGGSLEEFKKRIQEEYGNSSDIKHKHYYTEYMGFIEYIEKLKKLDMEVSYE